MTCPRYFIIFLQGDIKTTITGTVTNEYALRVDVGKVIKINRDFVFLNYILISVYCPKRNMVTLGP